MDNKYELYHFTLNLLLDLIWPDIHDQVYFVPHKLTWINCHRIKFIGHNDVIL